MESTNPITRPTLIVIRLKIGTCYRRMRHQGFLRFLEEIEANLPAGFEVHLVMDNYGTHKVAKVRDWLSRHPRALQGSL